MSDTFDDLRTLTAKKALWQQLVVTYVKDMTDLNTIINAATPTNAQVIWAVQREAQILRDVLFFLKIMYSDK